jgi:hypothetical protein
MAASDGYGNSFTGQIVEWSSGNQKALFHAPPAAGRPCFPPAACRIIPIQPINHSTRLPVDQDPTIPVQPKSAIDNDGMGRSIYKTAEFPYQQSEI